MENLRLVLPLLIGTGLVGVVFYLITRHYERQRTARLNELANRLSLEFVAAGDPALETALAELPLMQRGHSRKMSNLLRGRSRNIDLSLFDFQYTIRGGKSNSTYRLSVVAFDSPSFELPPFELTQENLLHRVAGLFGYQDIDFGGYPTFNAAFLLQGPDEAGIRDVFTEPVVQHLERAREQGMHLFGINAQANRLLVATRRQKPEQLLPFLEQAFGIYGILAAQTPPGDDPVLTHPADEG